MPVKGVYSNLIQPNQFIDPINLGLYAQGMEYKEGIAKQNLQDISALKNSIFNIPTYGKDKEKLLEIENSVKSQLENMNLSNLGDQSTSSQIKNLINKAARDPDVQAISQRYFTYANELKNKEQAEKQNKQYFSPILDQAEEYYGSGVYKTDTRFNGTGWNDPEINKQMSQILKDAPKIKTNVKQGNYWVSKESPDMDWVASRVRDLYDSPNARKTLEYNFDRQNKNRDWNSEGVYQLQQDLNKAQTALQINPNDKKAQDFINNNSQLLQNPQLLGQVARNKALNSQINQQINQDIAAANYESFGQMDADDFTLKALDHQYNLYETQAKDLSLGASMNGWTLQETMADPSKRQKALADTQSAKLAEFSSKESVKLQNKIAAKNDAIGSLKFTDSDVITYVDKNGDAKTLQYGTFKSEIKKADASTAAEMIASALNKKNSTDPQWIPLTADKVKVTGTGDKRKIRINSFYGFGGESIPFDDVLDISNFTQNKENAQTAQNNSTSYNKQVLLQKGYSQELIQKAIDALVAANADTTDANIEHVIKQNQ